jgi:hypothetical protein
VMTLITSSGVASRVYSRSMETSMTVEIANTADGLGLIVRVCEGNICQEGVMVCKEGFTSSMHLVEKKANELRAAIRKQAANTFREIQQLEAEAMGVPGPIHDC